MEDADLVHAPPGSDFAFIGVFDGHGGEKAAQFCREHLYLNVMASSSFRSGDPRAALGDGFRKTEADLIFEQRNRSKSGVDEGAPAGCCGSTVLLMLLQLESMHVAWLGDCRAVLCRSGEAIAITQDHCLKDEAERERALADGGTVVSNRLGGFLEVARALGDFDHTLGRKPAGLSAQPELRTQPLQPNDEFVRPPGSDGLRRQSGMTRYALLVPNFRRTTETHRWLARSCWRWRRSGMQTTTSPLWSRCSTSCRLNAKLHESARDCGSCLAGPPDNRSKSA